MSSSGDLLRILANRYLKESELFLRYGQEEPAAVLRRVAKDLEDERSIHESEPLTLDEAAEESGYSYSTLQRKVAIGELPNVGEKGAPRVRRGDLSLKRARRVDVDSRETTEVHDFADSIILSRGSR